MKRIKIQKNKNKATNREINRHIDNQSDRQTRSVHIFSLHVWHFINYWHHLSISKFPSFSIHSSFYDLWRTISLFHPQTPCSLPLPHTHTHSLSLFLVILSFLKLTNLNFLSKTYPRELKARERERERERESTIDVFLQVMNLTNMSFDIWTWDEFIWIVKKFHEFLQWLTQWIVLVW